jgi:hypothetical protein
MPRRGRTRLDRLWIFVGCGLLSALLVGGLARATDRTGRSAQAGIVPVAGDWEGSGPHGLPLSYELVRRGGHVVATAVTIGYPLGCPANERDSEAVPLSSVSYAGPGGLHSAGFLEPSTTAKLSGHFPTASGGYPALVTGKLNTPRSAILTAGTDDTVGCGWPRHKLTWTAHPTRRQHVPDGKWTAVISGGGLAGTVSLSTAGDGRVIASFAASYSFACQGNTVGGNVHSAPAYVFIKPNGTFASPEHINFVNGVPTTWSGTFSRAGGVSGNFTTGGGCENAAIHGAFDGRAAASDG